MGHSLVAFFFVDLRGGVIRKTQCRWTLCVDVPKFLAFQEVGSARLGMVAQTET